MLFRRFLLAAALVVAVASSALASRNATLLLRSGERISGSFEDIQDSQVYVRVSKDDERRIPVAEVVLIDFIGGTRGLPETELSAAREPGDFLLLRDGSRIQGTLVDVKRAGEGEETRPDAPVTVIFKTKAGESRELAIEQVGRLYLGPLPDLSSVPGALAEAPAPAHSKAFGPRDAGWVAANQAWTSTGITVKEGEFFVFGATGEVRLGPDHLAGPAGSKRQLYSARAPLPRDYLGALIARVGSTTFGIGDQTGPVRMPANGELFLGVNVNPDEVADNETGFNVTVTPYAAPASRRR